MRTPATIFPTLLAALFCSRAPAESPSTFPEPGPFHLIPTSAAEPVMFDRGLGGMLGVKAVFWKGSTLYVMEWPVEFERTLISLVQPYSFSAVAYQPQIHFLYIYPVEPAVDKRHFQSGNGQFNFNIGYQF